MTRQLLPASIIGTPKVACQAASIILDHYFRFAQLLYSRGAMLRGKKPLLVLDGMTGVGKTTIAREVGQSLLACGYDVIYIGSDYCLRDPARRLSEELAVVSGRLEAEKYSEVTCSYDQEKFKSILKQIVGFFLGKGQEYELRINDAYNPATKKMENMTIELRQGAIIIMEGCYVNLSEFQQLYDGIAFCCRIDDDPIRARERYVYRENLFGPQIEHRRRYFDLVLRPSFSSYDEATRAFLHGIVELTAGSVIWHPLKF